MARVLVLGFEWWFTAMGISPDWVRGEKRASVDDSG